MGNAFRGHLFCFGFAIAAACGGRSDVSDEDWEDDSFTGGGAGRGGAIGAGGAGARPSGRAGTINAGRGGSIAGGVAGRGGSKSAGGRGGRSGAGGRPGAGGRGGRGGTSGAGTAGSGGAGGFSEAGVGGVASFCGDGVVDPDERCDDGNFTDGDSCSSDCLTPNCLVPVTHPTFKAAIEDTTCSSIWVMPEDYSENLSIPRSVAIVALGSGANLTGATSGVIVSVTAGEVAISNLTIHGGTTVDWAAGIWNQSRLRLTNVTIEDNQSTGSIVRGAGIYSSGVLVLDASTVRRNVATANLADVNLPELGSALGAGIFVATGTLELLNGSVIEGNRAETTIGDFGGGTTSARGGGIYIDSGAVTLRSDSKVFENLAQVNNPAASGDAEGGGVYSKNGALTVDSGATISRNSVVASGRSGRARGGGIYGAGISQLKLSERTALTGNSAETGTSSDAAEGGGLFLALTNGGLKTNRTTFSENRATNTTQNGTARGGAISVDTDPTSGLTKLELDETRFFDNSVAATHSEGGGIALRTSGPNSIVQVVLRNSAAVQNRVTGARILGGFAFASSIGAGSSIDLALTNSTLTGNQLVLLGTLLDEGGGALYAAHGAGTSFAIELNNVTIAENHAGSAPALRLATQSASPFLAMRNSIIAHNEATSGSECALDAPMLSLGYNLYAPGRDCAGEGQTADDVLDVDPELSDPAMNGGFGETLAPARTSPAINRGDPGGCLDEADARLTRDQRGVARTDRCDIGAFEYQP